MKTIFLITLFNTPVVDVLSDQVTCDSLVLPILSLGSYYTNSNGSGISLSGGDNVYTSQILYIYENNGGCYDESTFNIIINQTPTIAVSQNLITLDAVAIANYQWLDCNSSYQVLIGQNSQTFVAETTGSFAVELESNGCIDTSDCIVISNQDFYDMPGYLGLYGEVFAYPVSVYDTCDANAISFGYGGVPPYSFNWVSQADLDFLSSCDSLCIGYYSLEITDNIGDSIFVDYVVTDTSNYSIWIDVAGIYGDTTYTTSQNCLIDMQLSVDSIQITNMYYISSSWVGMDLYFLELTYFQNGVGYLHQDSILTNGSGPLLIYFSVYCPFKSVTDIKSILFEVDFPEILSTNEKQHKNFFNLYPNPNNGNFALQFDKIVTSGELEIYNLMGQRIYYMTLSNTDQINISNEIWNCMSGNYMIRVTTDHNVSTQILIVN
ncbi:MAG: T9SS type A sorting domain-containing protein [Crocinitomicaceae bacterium]|nr:T9SS type A sorting domain-containing protein [Crocinitomicaceae bacterium]